MKLNVKHASITLLGFGLLLGFGALANGETADALARRYPYDPACPWGRIGNGKGLIVRCLSENEAQALRAGALVPTSPAASSGLPLSNPSAGAPNDAPASPDGAAELDAGAPSPVPAPSDETLDVTVGPVSADSGQLGIGKLAVPRDKYVKCLNDNGGLKEANAEVQVRFLLRQKGRAEGVSVAKRVGMSVEAARCVSEVVDRRFVGVPEAPIVGATVVIKFARSGK